MLMISIICVPSLSFARSTAALSSAFDSASCKS